MSNQLNTINVFDGTGSSVQKTEQKTNFKMTSVLKNNSDLQINILKTNDETAETFWSNIDNYR